MLSKRETAQYLEVSERTLERNWKKWGLARFNRPTATGEAAFYSRESVVRFKAAREEAASTAVYVPVEEPAAKIERALERTDLDIRASLEMEHEEMRILRATAALQISLAQSVLLASLPAKMTYNLREAAQVSGLTQTHLRRAIRDGTLEALRLPGVRGRRISRDALTTYVRGLFNAMPPPPPGGVFHFSTP